MKQLICFSLILSFPFVHSYSAEKVSTSQLAVQKSTALPAHLTTRIQWTTFPQPQYNHDDLKGQNRAAILRIYADETGKITQVIGPVVDVRFDLTGGQLPNILDALEIVRNNGQKFSSFY